MDRDSNDELSESDHSDILDDLADFDLSFMDDVRLGDSAADFQEKSLEDLAKEEIANWVVSNKIRHSHATELLHIIHPFMSFLPRDVRTLLKSMRKVINIVEVHPGRYYHFGLVAGLTTILESFVKPTEMLGMIEIYLSFDGMPLTKSTKKKFVPITATLVS